MLYFSGQIDESKGRADALRTGPHHQTRQTRQMNNINNNVPSAASIASDCTAQPHPMQDVFTLAKDSATLHAAKVMAVRAMIGGHGEYQGRYSTLKLLRGEHGSFTSASRDELRVAKSLDLLKTTGKWGQWTKTVGRMSSFAAGLLTMRIAGHSDPDSTSAKAQRHCLVKHSAAVNTGPTSAPGVAFLQLFSTILTTLKATSFNTTPCGYASREDGMLDSLIESANHLLNYDLGGLDGGTCSEALCAIQEAYRQA